MKTRLAIWILMGLVISTARAQIVDGFGDGNQKPYVLQYPHSAEARAVENLLAEKKFQAALEQLQKYGEANDRYYCDCNDAPHHHRLGQRIFHTAQALVGLNRQEEARLLLRSLFEKKYVFEDEVKTLLLELETPQNYDEFQSWIERYASRSDLARVVQAKRDIEGGRYHEGLKAFQNGSADDFIINMPRWGQAQVAAYYRRNPKSLDALLEKLDEIRFGFGTIFSIGEIGERRAIPFLRKAKQQNQNWYVNLSFVLALAKCGDSSVAKELFDAWFYFRADLQRQIPALLTQLTRQNLGGAGTEEGFKTAQKRWHEYFQGQEAPKVQ